MHNASSSSESKVCHYCGYPTGHGKHAIGDHFPIPGAAGGNATVPACWACHNLKDNISVEKLLFEFGNLVDTELHINNPFAINICEVFTRQMIELPALSKQAWPLLNRLQRIIFGRIVAMRYLSESEQTSVSLSSEAETNIHKAIERCRRERIWPAQAGQTDPVCDKPRRSWLADALEDTTGIEFESRAEKIDATTAAGRLVFHVFAALAEFERNLVRERTHAGLAAARARGRKGGRRELDAEKQGAIAKMADQPPAVVCKALGISRATFYKYAKQADHDGQRRVSIHTP